LAAGLTLTLVAVVVLGASRWPRARAPEGPGEEPPAPPAPRPLLPYPVTVVPGVHLLGGLSPAAAYVVETSAGLVLIDAGFDPEAATLKREMASLGLDWQKTCAVLLTHAHGDHSGGAQYLREATGAKVYAGQGDAAVLRAGGPREAFYSTFFMPGANPRPTTVDVGLSGEQTVTIGDARFLALATPGHTPGSVCYQLERGGRQILFSGDVIWSLWGAPNSRDKQARPLGTYAAYLAPRYRGSAAGFLATLRRLREMPPPQLVLPGHPRNDPANTSPLMTPARWLTLLDTGIREMEQLQARLSRDGAAFLDDSPKKLLDDLYYLGNGKGAAVYAFVVSSKLFLVGAPGGPGLGEFVKARLASLGVKPSEPSAVLLTSGNPEETAGLPGLLATYRCPVVARPAAWDAVKAACPPATTAWAPEELAVKSGLSVKGVELAGRGVAPTAYTLSWHGKSVLFSGRLPIKRTETAVKGLYTEFSEGRGNPSAYRASLDRLAGLKPDLWLPSFPIDGQNAFLYDSEWQDTLDENRELFP
jgi:glyoxylase-like metal-dependent hydrolase (beta-lactamase superfamily II)